MKYKVRRAMNKKKLPGEASEVPWPAGTDPPVPAAELPHMRRGTLHPQVWPAGRGTGLVLTARKAMNKKGS